jgi:hypothetical protein
MPRMAETSFIQSFVLQILHIVIRNTRSHNLVMARARQPLKPQDVLVLLKLIAIAVPRAGDQKKDRVRLRQIDLAEALGLSQPEIVHCFARLKHSGLLSEHGELRPLAAIEFLVHGLKYVFPADLRGGLGRGHLTCAAAVDELKKKLGPRDQPEHRFVWPSPAGRERGVLLEPIYPSAPAAAVKDPGLYDLLALIDSLRLGDVRERQMAQACIERIIRQVRE